MNEAEAKRLVIITSVTNRGSVCLKIVQLNARIAHIYIGTSGRLRTPFSRA